MLVGTKNFQVELYQVSSLHCFYIARSVAMKHLRIFNLNNGCHYFGNTRMTIILQFKCCVFETVKVNC